MRVNIFKDFRGWRAVLGFIKKGSTGEGDVDA